MNKNIYVVCLKRFYHFFEDYILSIKKNTNIKLIVEDYENLHKSLEHVRDNIKNYCLIFVTISKMNIYKLDKYKNIYILNTEQLTKKNEIKKIQNFIKKGYKILDYSTENISINKNSIYIPYQVNFNEIHNFKKDHDLCYIGHPFGSYRLNLLKKIKDKTKINIIGQHTDTKIKHMWGNKWGFERDNFAFRHKILVNIHHNNDYLINEQMRINRCIFNKMIVISESGLNDDLLYLKKYIIFEKYENIVNKVEDVLKNYEYYYNKLFSDFDINEINKHYSEHLNKIICLL